MRIVRYFDSFVRARTRRIFLDANAGQLLEALKKRIGILTHFIEYKVGTRNQGHDVSRALYRTQKQLEEAKKLAEGERVPEFIVSTTGPARWRGGGGFVYHEEKGSPKEIADKAKNALGTITAGGIKEKFEEKGMPRAYSFIVEAIKSIIGDVNAYRFAKAAASNAARQERAAREAVKIEAGSNPAAANFVKAAEKVGGVAPQEYQKNIDLYNKVKNMANERFENRLKRNNLIESKNSNPGHAPVIVRKR